jgi:hypothetical protein
MPANSWALTDNDIASIVDLHAHLLVPEVLVNSGK